MVLRGSLRTWSAAAIVLLVAALAIGSALVIVDRLGERIIAQQSRAALIAERDYMARLQSEEGTQSLIATLDRRERVHGGPGMRYALSSAAGRPLAGAAQLIHPGAPPGWKIVRTVDSHGVARWRALASNLPSGDKLLIAEDLGARRSFRRAIFEASAVALTLAALAGAAVGLVFSGVLLQRANAIAATAERIATGEFHARVPVAEGGDVFDRLGRSLNVMLGRIEELMTGLRTVTDSLAHDLRSPLGRLKAAIARAADPTADEATRQAALEEARLQADAALATFSALIDIAQAESGLSREMMEPTDVRALVEGVVDLFAPVLEDAGQTVVLDVSADPLDCRTHPLLLRQAVGNLMHNAARYAGPGATVTVTVRREGRGVEVIVADDGPGVPDADRARIQERFVRLDAARSTQGSGLGLAIVAACARLHDGRLVIEDNHPGLRAILVLGE